MRIKNLNNVVVVGDGDDGGGGGGGVVKRVSLCVSSRRYRSTQLTANCFWKLSFCLKSHKLRLQHKDKKVDTV